MRLNEPDFAADESGRVQDELRLQVARVLQDRVEMIAEDTLAIFPYSGAEPLDPEYSHRIGHLLAELLAFAVREGKLDPRGSFVPDLHRIVLDRGLSMERLFTFAYLTERTALDELALDESIGATSEAWPVVAQLVRRASFDLLGAYAERALLEPGGTSVVDRLTTLYTRPMFEAVLAKELERAGRVGYSVSLILFDVDELSPINEDHGYGVGDRILERLGILIRTYFRQHDWVARYSEDSIAVLLLRTEPNDAGELAEHVRSTVQERLGFKDHRTDQMVTVTLSAGLLNAQVSVGDIIDPARLLADAEALVARAKQQGRNRVERVDGYPYSSS